MTKIQQWFLIVAMWVVIVFLVFAFYWVFMRPGRIRQMCAARARQVCVETKSGVANMLEINRAIYLDCLRCHGIDK